MLRIDIPKKILDTEYHLIAELGVDEGSFSREILETYPNATVLSIDKWSGDGHGEQEFSIANRQLSRFNNRNILMKADVSDKIVVDLFDDCIFDMIYFDVYAHEPYNMRDIFHLWYPKIKWNGIMSGHDYDYSDQTKSIIDDFNKDYMGTPNKDGKLHFTKPSMTKNDQFISWWFRK